MSCFSSSFPFPLHGHIGFLSLHTGPGFSLFISVFFDHVCHPHLPWWACKGKQTMQLVNLSKVSKDFGGNTVFSDLDLDINEGERVGLVGENGCGKSTLFKLLAGIEDPTEGTIARKRHMTHGYLTQEIDPRQLDRTVFEVVQEVSPAFSSLIAHIHALEHQMASSATAANPATMERVLNAY